jgi:hypothetical protein
MRVLVEKRGRTWDVIELRPNGTRWNISMRVHSRAAAEGRAHKARMDAWFEARMRAAA